MSPTRTASKLAWLSTGTYSTLAPMLSKMPPMTWAMTIWLDQFLMGILIGSLLSAFAVPAMASTAAEMIPVSPPFIVRFTTILP